LLSILNIVRTFKLYYKIIQQSQSKPPTASSQSKQPQHDVSENPEVMEFLNSVKLTKYADTFVENGFEDLETILELNEEYLETIGIPLGHKLKIMKRIKQIKADAPTENNQTNDESHDVSQNVTGASTDPHLQDGKYSSFNY